MDDMDNITGNSLQIAGATSLASLAAGLGCWLWLPDKIEFWGSITMPKEVGIILIPVLGIVLTLMLALVVKCDPLCENLDSSSQAAMSVIVMSPSLFSPVLQVIVLWAAFTEHSLGITPVAFLFSVFLVILGGSFNYVEQNHVVGIRDPWTLASAHVWEEVHCLATKLFMLAGLVGMVAVWFIPPGLWQLILMGAITLVPLIICSVYSFLIREDAQYQYIVR
jgi:uncharacterized membrane protein